MPGVSRSGATIAAGMALGMRRDESARFVFLLGVPAILAAAVKEGLPLVRHGLPPGEGPLFAAGIVSSAVVGYLAVRFFIRYVGRHSLAAFAWYRLALAAAVVVWWVDPVDDMAAPHALHWLRRRFITGFFVAVPLIISVAALLWVFQLIDDLSGPVYDRLLGRHVAGLGVATTAAFVLLVGVVASNVLGKRLLARGESYLARIPVFRTIYSPVKQLLAAFSPGQRVGAEAGGDGAPTRRGAARLGFLTKEFEVDRGPGVGRQAYAAVYVPTNNLYLGDVFVYRRDALLFPEISVEEGVRVFLTGGMAMADRLAVRAGRQPDHLSS